MSNQAFDAYRELERLLEKLRRAIVEHRTAIYNAGTVKVQPGYKPVAEAKHRADERLWKAMQEGRCDRTTVCVLDRGHRGPCERPGGVRVVTTSDVEQGRSGGPRVFVVRTHEHVEGTYVVRADSEAEARAKFQQDERLIDWDGVEQTDYMAFEVNVEEVLDA